MSVTLQCLSLVVTVWSSHVLATDARPVETIHVHACWPQADMSVGGHNTEAYKHYSPCNHLALQTLDDLQVYGVLPGSKDTISYVLTCEASV